MVRENRDDKVNEKKRPASKTKWAMAEKLIVRLIEKLAPWQIFAIIMAIIIGYCVIQLFGEQ